MTTDHKPSSSQQAPGPHPLRAAVEARNLDAMIDTLAPDIVFYSPLISTPLRGRAQVGELFRALSETFLFGGHTRCTRELESDGTVVLVFRTLVNGTEVEGVDVLQVDDERKIREMTVFLRPLPGTAAVAEQLAPRLGGAGSRAKAAGMKLGLKPLSAMAALFDSLGSRTVRRGS